MNDAEQSPMLGRHRHGPHLRGNCRAVMACGSGLLMAGALILSGCSGQPVTRAVRTAVPPAADVALMRFTSCADALANLRAAAVTAARSGSGTPASLAAGNGPVAGAQAPPASAAGTAAGTGAAAQAAGSAESQGSYQAANSYSGTNTATAGVDEPDLVKTDGQHIVTVIGNVLRVVDTQTRQLTGVLDLTAGASPYAEAPANLLLSGDRALVIFGQDYLYAGGPVPAGPQYSGTATVPRADIGSPIASPIAGPRMELIDLSGGSPRIISEYTMDGALVDARQVGSVVRVVVHSAPRIYYPYPAAGQGAQPGGADWGGLAPGAPGAGGGTSGSGSASESGAAIGTATISAWLPRYQVTDGAGQRTGLVDCAAVSHPADGAYSGTSMLTVLTFDLSGSSLGTGLPVTVVADGQTVYSDGASLFIANDQQWTGPAQPVAPGYAAGPTAQAGGTAPAAVPQQYTGLYKFDISQPGRPVYEASGAVPGWLLGSADMAQYSLSQWNGSLRVATTDGAYWGGPAAQSAVYVLQQASSQLVIIGKVGGLGNGEQLYAVRFAGPLGYVVTFRQVDPLYTLDLSDPAQPRVAGQLMLTGYSAYLDPIDATRLIGIGQDAGTDGQTLGTQISLFDVSDITAPVRLAVFRLPFGHSEAEFDPHAFLYWPPSRLLVIPVQLSGGLQPQPGPATASPPVTGQYEPGIPVSEAIVLRVGDHSITSLGTITQPASPGYPAGSQIRRSLVAYGALWTLSDAGLKANDLTTLAPLGWVPFG